MSLFGQPAGDGDAESDGGDVSGYWGLGIRYWGLGGASGSIGGSVYAGVDGAAHGGCAVQC